MIVSSAAGFTTDIPDPMIENSPPAGTLEALRRATLSRRRKVIISGNSRFREFISRFGHKNSRFSVHGNFSASNYFYLCLLRQTVAAKGEIEKFSVVYPVLRECRPAGARRCSSWADGAHAVGAGASATAASLVNSRKVKLSCK
jgi:hypothetical protein